jgi:ribosomal protein RSM22 (predicted rRNA methylase)
MIPPSVPAELKAALDAKLEGLSRTDVATRAAAISKTYREGGTSGAIASEIDALAYALARMPATYAAVVATLNALHDIRPDFAPQSLLDVGAGPGTASWAAAEAFPTLANFLLLDANPTLRGLALELATGSSRLGAATYQLGQARELPARAGQADLVMASYLIGELAEGERRNLVDAMWARTRDILVIVEPGTPAGYARITAGRAQLIASGAHVAAPCPHDHACPLQAPDWCHFAQRLPRSRAHMQMKGAEVPFEDEKFSYVILTRAPPTQHPSRVLASPMSGKAGITAKLCTPNGLALAKVTRRDKAAYARARRWGWGDTVKEKS